MPEKPIRSVAGSSEGTRPTPVMPSPSHTHRATINHPKRFGWLIVALCVWLGLGITGVGLVPSLLPATLLMGFSGISTGVVNTYAVSWLQRRTDPAMQGRVMSLVMLASLGLTPVAYAVSGVIADVNPTLLFVIAGGMILLCAAGTAASRTVRSLR